MNECEDLNGPAALGVHGHCRTRRAPTAATASGYVAEAGPALHAQGVAETGRVWAATWKPWPQAALRKLSSWGRCRETRGRSPLWPSSQPASLAFHLPLRFGSCCVSICHGLHTAMPLLGSKHHCALMLQPLATRPSLPSVLALPWDADQRTALNQPLKLCKRARPVSCCTYPF